MIKILIGKKLRVLTRIQYYVDTGYELAERSITEIKTAGGIVWQGIRSCFGKGYWLDDKPWLDDDAWKD